MTVGVGTPVVLGKKPAGLATQNFGGGFSPLQISGLVAWYDFSDATTLYTDAGTTNVTADADQIYQINDKSGGAFHLTQIDPAKRPIYKVNIQNSKSVGRFSAAAAQVLNRETTPIQAQPWTVLCVFKATTGTDRIVAGGASTNWYMSMTAADKLGMYAGTLLSGSPSIAAAWTVGSGIYNGASTLSWVNGAADLTTGNIGANAIAGINIGAWSNEVIAPMEGDVAEVLVYSGALSAGDRGLAEDYLGAKYGITMA